MRIGDTFRSGVETGDQRLMLGRAVVDEVVLHDCKVGHGCIDHGREGVFAVFRDDDVASPCGLLFEGLALNIADSLVDGKRHTIAGDGRVEDDVWISKLAVHPIEGFNQLDGKRLLTQGFRAAEGTEHVTWYFQARDPRPSAI